MCGSMYNMLLSVILGVGGELQRFLWIKVDWLLRYRLFDGVLLRFDNIRVGVEYLNILWEILIWDVEAVYV